MYSGQWTVGDKAMRNFDDTMRPRADVEELQGGREAHGNESPKASLRHWAGR